MPPFISFNSCPRIKSCTLNTNLATWLTLLISCFLVAGCGKEEKDAGKADSNAVTPAAAATKKVSPAADEKKSSAAAETPKAPVETVQPSGKSSTKKPDKRAREDDSADWQQLILLLGFFVPVLVLLLLLIVTLVQVVAVKKQLRALSASLKREMDEIRSSVQILPKQLAQILDRRIEEHSMSFRDNGPPTKAHGDSMVQLTRSDPVTMQSPGAKSVISAFLICASEVHPMGGIIRVRLDAIARLANCSTADVRSILASANSAYSSCGHPILRRENFLSVVESRSDNPGESPYVAAISNEALQAMKENTPN